MDVSLSNPQVTGGIAAGGVGLVWFFVANRAKFVEIGKALLGLFSLWKSRKAQPELPSEASPEVRAAYEASEAEFKCLIASIQALNKAELDLIANGHYEGLAAIAAARKAVDCPPDTKTSDAAIVDYLFYASRYFREKSDKAGLDAVIAAYKALKPAAPAEVTT